MCVCGGGGAHVMVFMLVWVCVILGTVIQLRPLNYITDSINVSKKSTSSSVKIIKNWQSKLKRKRFINVHVHNYVN